ncbi:hypothetical protein Hanom_Chr09g00840631 [Helianthus anomalus]
MELMSRIKMARFQTLWIHMRKNKPLDECRKTGQTSGMKMHFTRERIIYLMENFRHRAIICRRTEFLFNLFEALQNGLHFFC